MKFLIVDDRLFEMCEIYAMDVVPQTQKPWAVLRMFSEKPLDKAAVAQVGV